MRILLLVEQLTIGGLPNYVLDLARALGEEGEQVALAHLGERAPEYLDCSGVELLSLPTEANAALARVRAWNADLVHVHLCSDLPLLQVLAASGIPLLRSFHDYTSMCLRRGRRRFPGDRCSRALGWGCATQGCLIGPPAEGGRLPRLMNLPAKLRERGLYQQASLAVVGSRHMRQVLLVNGFDAGRIRLIPYFSRFAERVLDAGEAAAKPAGLAEGARPLRLLFAGQAVEGKGLEVLVRALALVRGNWELHAVSSGPRLQPARELARELGLEERIHFIEWLPQGELAAHYRAADLFVLPSIWDDPGPLVGIEALSFRTPVLAFPVGGIVDYVEHGVTGLLTRAVNAEALGEMLQQALDEPARLPLLGEAGQQLVLRRHRRQQHLAAMREAYALCLGRESVTIIASDADREVQP